CRRRTFSAAQPMETTSMIAAAPVICDRSARILWGAMLLAAAVLLVSGRLAPQIVPDTAGYLTAGSWAERLSQSRFPLFGVLMEVFSAGGYLALPAACMAAFFAAVAALFFALRRFGASGGAALALALPLLVCNPVLLFSGYVHPEVLSLACMLAAFACLVRFAADGGVRDLALFGLALGLSYLLKPGFLPMALIMPVAFLLMARLSGRVRLVRGAVAVLLVGFAPFLVVGGLRWHLVRDFNIVSFGGVTLSGIAGSILTPQIAAGLPERHRALAEAILAARDRLEAERRMLPMPPNSRGERSFTSVALGYFDVLARNFDAVVYGAVLPQRGGEEGWVAFNARLQDFAVQTFRRAPAAYAAWVAGGATRAAGLMLAANAAFMLAALLLAAVAVLRVFGVHGRVRPGAAPDWPLLAILAAAFTLGAVAPTVLLAFPARRYVDSGGILLAALPAYGAWRLWCGAGMER
ncbi:MAG: hypothetical protein AB7D00_13020, partial [Rhodospirillaceae bacterium]